MDFFNKTTLPKTTEVYHTYWKFAAERQNIFFKRWEGSKFPWTEDAILETYKFTNVYRASDRVSQYLIGNVIYNAEWDVEDLVFRILLFKTFNKISTWEYLEKRLGEISYKSFSVQHYAGILQELDQVNKVIYSGAYIMASGKSSFGRNKKFENHLLLLHHIMKDSLPSKISKAKQMEEVYELLIKYPTIGSFLAYQYTIDLNYSGCLNFDENDFVMPGPGALSGIQKCFDFQGKVSKAHLIQHMVDHQEVEFDRLGLNFKTLWGRQMHLIDCQNLFCEVDKYARIAHPEITSDQNRKRIKQHYKVVGEGMDYWFPPKWKLNEKIQTNA